MTIDLDGLAFSIDERARKSGNNYSVRCVVHDDNAASLSIGLNDTGDKLLANCFAGCDGVVVFRTIIERFSGRFGLTEAGRNVTPRTERPATPAPRPVETFTPPPVYAPMPDFERLKPSDATAFVAAWRYAFGDGSTYGYVTRYATADGKTIRPVIWKDGRWSFGGFGSPRPLYGLPVLAANPDARVFVVEGEKCAHTLQSALPSNPVITWSGGAAAWQKTDLTPLRGRRLILWPDNDAPGFAAMNGIADALASSNPDIKFVQPDADSPKGFDCADVIESATVPVAEYIKARLVESLSGQYARQDESDDGEVPLSAHVNDAPSGEELPAEYVARRERNQREATEIGRGDDQPPVPMIFRDIADAESRMVYISDGSRVAPLENPRHSLPWGEASRHYNGSVMTYEDQNGKVKQKPVLAAWLSSEKRITVHTMTFKAGAGLFTQNPEGISAVNLWRPIPHSVPDGWKEKAKIFVDHVEWLFGDQAKDFLDWLAHIQQQPGVLPHNCWLHIATKFGLGRNWISCVLARVWRGQVAANFDLIAMMDSGFNGDLSGRVLVTVDEINEGAGGKWKHAEKFKSIITPEHRRVNPKFGRQHVEFNSARWLIFSNHYSALPLPENDRRVNVADFTGDPKPSEYYKRLYGALSEGIAESVRQFLIERDISNYEAGKHAPLSSAKARLVSSTISEADEQMQRVVRLWPYDLITVAALRGACGEFSTERQSLARWSKEHRHAIERAGMMKLPYQVRLVAGESTFSVYAIRHHDLWRQSSGHHAANVLRGYANVHTNLGSAMTNANDAADFFDELESGSG